jgi:hypothetical protein
VDEWNLSSRAEWVVGGWVGGWVGLQKLITVLGRFYPYKDGVNVFD